MTSLLERPAAVFAGAIALRFGLLFYGLWQDENSAIKYTDIDYFVFTDAARYVWQGRSPYLRDTYRYTPLLAWILTPTAWGGVWFSFGKVVFAVGDILTGWLMVLILQQSYGLAPGRAVKFAAIWLLNPMVATISTRGSSEGLVALTVAFLLWASSRKRSNLAGILLGLAVHLKIYPFLYAVSIFWNFDQGWSPQDHLHASSSFSEALASVQSLITPQRIRFFIWSAVTFFTLNMLMYIRYCQHLRDLLRQR